MNEHTFLSALHDDPDDEVTWLALADWLEESGQDERSELLRLAHHLRTQQPLKRTKRRRALEDRYTRLLNAGVKPTVPEFVNSIGLRFALIPSGLFRMGSPRGERGRNSNELQHEVTLTTPFYLTVFPVTQARYQQLMGVNPAHFSENGAGKAQVVGLDTSDFPIERVSWLDARAFCAKLNEAEPDRDYRLPTEAEWEFACRAFTTTPFHYGTSLSSAQANFNGNYPDGDAGVGPALARPCPVGSYLPNGFGLYDMHGNCLEWVNDCGGQYGPGPVVDPQGPETGTDRVVRGGNWATSAKVCRSANRHANPHNSDYTGVTFRVAFSAKRKGS